MKTIIATLLMISFCFVGPHKSHAQVKANMIGCEEYGNITFNHHTIDELNATEGDPAKLANLLGTPSDVKTLSGTLGKRFVYGKNKILFRYERGYTEGEITNLEINDDSWPVEVKGKTIKVGCSESDLKEKFGSDFKVHESPISDLRFASFNCPVNSYSGTTMDIDPSTKQVTKLIYYVLP